MKVAAIIPAAGKGVRLGSKIHKPFIVIGKEPILTHILEVIDGSNYIDEIIVVINEPDLAKARALVKKNKLKKVKEITLGGKRRMDSVKNGLSLVSEDVDYVIVHDGVRPFLDNKMIASVIEGAKTFGAAITCVPVKPTIKEIEKGGFVSATLKRESLIEVQTPQAFKKDILERAYKKAFDDGIDATDDSALVERLGIKVKAVAGSYKNIKITTAEDLKYAKALIE
ncbi:MAG: 2-C-methyl-D-erythritol 4-phosphate cytidylyltransferase [Candidatus Omnitrophota bacterium]